MKTAFTEMLPKDLHERPFFSIILPTYNSAKTLGKALESIASQTFPSFEVRIMDNLSSDGTLEVASNYFEADKRFIWQSEKDKGIYYAMNKGISVSNGQWLFFLGSDDYFYSDDVLETVYNHIMSEKSVDMVYGNVWLSRPLPPNLDTCFYGGKYTLEKLLRKNICHQCMFYNKQIFQRFGDYSTRYIIYGDYDFNLRIFNKVRTSYIDKIIAFYNLEGFSGTSHNLDAIFGTEFLENMATRYSYSFTDRFFDGKKRELFGLLISKVKKYKISAASSIATIIAYQAVIKPIQNKLSRSAKRAKKLENYSSQLQHE